MFDVSQFLADRKKALLSMNKTVIEAYMRKYDVSFPSSDNVFWIMVHKARTGALDLPMEERAKSEQWLRERGYGSMDDGDIPA